MSHLEIGSFFPWPSELNEQAHQDTTSPSQRGELLCFSGQTALRLILEDIEAVGSHGRRIAYVPSYCCASMLRPFEQRGYDLEFYKVSLDDNFNFIYDIDTSMPCKVFLAMSYFGIGISNMDFWISQFRKNGVVTVEDITHRYLSSPSSCDASQYAFASIRKWVGVASGGVVRGLKSKSVDYVAASTSQIRKGDQAMCLKEVYLASGERDARVKRRFLDLMNEYESEMCERLLDLSIDSKSRTVLQRISFDSVRERRITNAQTLISGLSKLNLKIGLPEGFRWEGDCPLFVPIFVPAHVRDDLVKYLAKNQIYCPVHWPIPFGNDTTVNDGDIRRVYDTEVSIPIDQRYDRKDMNRIAEIIGEFFAKP